MEQGIVSEQLLLIKDDDEAEMIHIVQNQKYHGIRRKLLK
jgi:hypothetical protein